MGFTSKIDGSEVDSEPVIDFNGTAREIVIRVVAQTQNVSVGDGKAFIPVGQTMDGRKLCFIALIVDTANGNVSLQVHNETKGVDMLTTNVTIDTGEQDSTTAAVPAVIDLDNNNVDLADRLRLDIDAAGNPKANGLTVILGFK